MRGLKRLAPLQIFLEKFLTFLEPKVPIFIALKHFLTYLNQQIIESALAFKTDFCILRNITSKCLLPIDCC